MFLYWTHKSDSQLLQNTMKNNKEINLISLYVIIHCKSTVNFKFMFYTHWHWCALSLQHQAIATLHQNRTWHKKRFVYLVHKTAWSKRKTNIIRFDMLESLSWPTYSPIRHLTFRKQKKLILSLHTVQNGFTLENIFIMALIKTITNF